MEVIPEKYLKLIINPLELEGIRDDIIIKDMTGKAPEGYQLSGKRFMALSNKCVGYGDSHLEALINCYKSHDIELIESEV